MLYFIFKSECVAHKRYKISRARNRVLLFHPRKDITYCQWYWKLANDIILIFTNTWWGKLILLGISCNKHWVPLSLLKEFHSPSIFSACWYGANYIISPTMIFFFPSLTEQLFLGLSFLLVLSSKHGYHPLLLFPSKEILHSRLRFCLSPGSKRGSLP